MSDHRKGPSNAPGLLVVGTIGAVGGIIFADHSIRANPDSLMAIAGLGMIATVFGIGYALNIKNPFRFGLALVGGAGLGLLLRGGATMF